VGTGSASPLGGGGQSDRDQPHRRHGPVRKAAGQAEISRTAGAGPARPEVGPLVRQDIDRTVQTRARLGCKTVGRVGLEIGRGIQVRVGWAARGYTGKAAPRQGRVGKGGPRESWAREGKRPLHA
jgi:hypothetical protein